MFVIIFAVGLLPPLLILILSAYLLRSTLDRMGASGLEKSLVATRNLMDESQNATAALLRAKLPATNIWSDKKDLINWLNANNLDLAFTVQNGTTLLALSDSVAVDSIDLNTHLPDSSGFAHLECGGHFYLAYSLGDSSAHYGCAILMPAGYGEDGRILANSLSISASLGMYKAFSLKLLGAATAIAVILALGMAIIFSAIITGHLVKPLEILGRGAAAVGAGDLDYKVEIGGNDEFAKLANSFNNMAADIKSNQEKLLEAQRLAAWREVARRIAHEIKNPLTPINIELYRLQEMLNKESGQHYDESSKSLEAIRLQIQTLQDLALQFSTFAKEPELRLARCSLRDIITHSVRVFNLYKNVYITLDLQDDLPLANIDSQMMGRVFSNLIKNAIEARPADAKINISAKTHGEFIQIIIRDNGPGFPPEKLEKIDQPYITTKKTGTGLGLVIVKKIVDEHGGKVSFYNDNGAAVEMELPV